MKTIAIMKSLIFLIGINLSGFQIFSQAQSESNNNALPLIKGFRFTTENDIFFPVNNQDKNYTGQFRMDLYLRQIFDKGIPFPFIRNSKEPRNNLQSFFIHGMGYTPAREYFSSVDPVTTDRPFASYLCGGFQRTSWWDVEKTMLKLSVGTELSVGAIGSEAPGKFQNFLHEYVTVKSDPVLGWHNQVGNPGRFAYYYRVHGIWIPQKKYREVKVGLRYDLMPIGYFMRYEKIGLSISNMGVSGLALSPDIPSFRGEGFQAAQLRRDSLNSLKGKTQKGHVKFVKEKGIQFGWELFPSIKYVHWNSMLSGHPVDDESVYKISEHDVYKLVPEASLRLKVLIPRAKDGRTFTIFYAANVRAREFSGGDHIHFWGTFGVQTMKD